MHTASVQLGQICHVSFEPGEGQAAWGFDAGPGTVLLEAWHKRHPELAALPASSPNYGLLEALLADDYFATKPPKSVGAEYFDVAWLQSKLLPFAHLGAPEVEATLIELTARCVRSAIALYAPDASRLCASGEGASNPQLLKRLQVLMPTAALAVDRETLLFK